MIIGAATEVPRNSGHPREEVTGYSCADELRPEDVRGGYLLGLELFDRLRLDTARTLTLACGLRWFPDDDGP
jgi:hypothetical protein